MRSVRSTLAAAAGFDFKIGRTISGGREGLYLWLGVNYASGALFEEEPMYRGVMDLGGASTQIAFSSGAEPARAGAAFVEVGGSTLAGLTINDRTFGKYELQLFRGRMHFLH